ncbi:MAG TPA: hypothetical protein VL049_04400 [Candidatus Dormibacteraeota bacterium]|nr:hypothetical protein [Candidatus Dormibacteraeota bacterium]
MAEKKAKTAQKGPGAVMVKHACPSCGSDSRVTYFTGYGPQKGFFWVCDKGCGYMARTK